MHELSLAMRIVEIACERARAAGARRINAVEVEVGALSGVMAEALAFCFEAAAQGPAAGARLLIREVEGRAACRACGREFSTDSLLSPCPGCGEYAAELLSGRELAVLSLIVDEEEGRGTTAC